MELVRNESPSADNKAMVFAQQELERYLKEHPIPDNVPVEVRKHLIETFKKQAAKNWLAGYEEGFADRGLKENGAE